LLTILAQTESTNNYAMQLVHDGLAKHGTAVAALHQTAGKGQRGKTWQTPAGNSIAISVIIKVDALKPNQQFLLSMAVALASYSFITKYIVKDVSLKWPNDLYWQNKKLGGILIENIFSGAKWKWAVVGIGLNVNQQRFNGSLPNPVSVRQITQREFDIEKLLTELHNAVLEKLETIRLKNFDDLVKEYNDLLYCLNQPVKLKKGNQVFTTTIKGVNAHGQLLTADVIERLFNFGEVEWIL
jgi:BirA family transcriptional regulator, biotin operon repressor / biotin---[acetyl-CoA-carboxylase] ligase